MEFPPQLNNPHCWVKVPFHLHRWPRLLQVPWYPTCILEFSFKRTANLLTLIDSLYPTFVVYLTTIYGRLSFIDWPKSIEWIIQSFKEPQERFPDLFYKVTTFFLFCQVPCQLFFSGFRYRVSFITYKFQTLYKYTYLFLICQTFFSKCTIIINISFFSKVGHVFNICPFFLKNWTHSIHMSILKIYFGSLLTLWVKYHIYWVKIN